MSSTGYDLLPTALADLVQTVPTVGLRIVGDAPLRKPLAQQIARPGLSRQVESPGRQGIEAMRPELSRADLFVISSPDEGLPRTLLGAAAAGVPVIATSVGARWAGTNRGAGVATGWFLRAARRTRRTRLRVPGSARTLPFRRG